MSASKLDAVYRSILLTKFFTKGWGKPENLRRLFEFRKVVSNREQCFQLIERDYPVTITKEQKLSDCKLLEGYFTTPLEKFLPGIVPEVAQKAYFQALVPLRWPDPSCKPMCLHLAGTGDHFFWRRRNLMVKPLLKEAGIGGIILENPFYGLRKPIDQKRSSLHNVSDIFVMGGCLILESLVLFHWCERNGLGPLGVTGLSMGGHMASLAATNWPKPLVLVPCLSWSTASAVFLQGVMSQSINWDLLEDQYLSDGIYREKLSKMVTIVDEPFLAGKKFARTITRNIEKKIQTDPQADKHIAKTIDETIDKTIDKHIGETIDKNIDKHIDVTIDKTIDKHIDETLDKSIDKHIDTIDKALETPIDKMIEKTVVKNLDMTNKETKSKNQSLIVDSKNVMGIENGPKVVKVESFAQMENLNEELKLLLEENKISQVLYEKLTSNEKFELDPQDIEDINKLNEAKVKKVLLRCKVANSKRKDAPGLPSTDPTQHTEPTEKPNITAEVTPSTDTKSTEDLKMTETSLPSLQELSIRPRRKSWSVVDLTSDLWINLPFMRSSGKKINISKINWRDREALQFMRGIMDECTHLSNFSVPYDTSLIIAVCAKHDAYVPRVDVGTLEEIWPGAEVRYVEAGHVSAYILHQSLFRSSIKEAFDRSKLKWKDGKHLD